jgi:SAM-dependent methyltransferase
MPDWLDAWRAGRTPWDAGKSPPALRSLVARDLVPAGRVFVPGCGSGYDLATLAREDREVVGLDLSELARASFERTRSALPGTVRYEVGDFFTFDDGRPFDFVWDYTFFCALDPSQRDAWATVMKRLLLPGATLATLIFPYEEPISDREGPPWPINTGLVRRTLGDAFELLEAAEVDESHPGREGREVLALWQARA